MNQRSGFTLIELSIVLVIIGLIIGGVMVGQQLVHAAQIRQQAKQFELITSAVNTFKTKYNCLPGDCPYATQLFGALATPTNGVACASAVSDGILTCDGNGDGQIDVVSGLGIWGNYEMAHFWVQLSAANLFPGTYSGQVDSTYNGGIPGVYFPTTMIGDNSGIQLMMSYFSVAGGGTGGAYTWPFPPGYVFEVGTMVGGESDGVWLSASDAFMLDSKIDDGMPSSGYLQAFKPLFPSVTPAGNNCATSSNPDAQYQSGTSIQCNFLWIANF